MLNLKKKKEK